MDKKFVVAKGCSFVGNKKTYNEGDEIDESAFNNDKKRFESFQKADFPKKGDLPKIVPAPSGETKTETEKEEDLSGVDTTGITAPTREDIEKLILEKGLLKEEKMKKFSDNDLLKFAVKRGLIQK